MELGIRITNLTDVTGAQGLILKCRRHLSSISFGSVHLVATLLQIKATPICQTMSVNLLIGKEVKFFRSKRGIRGLIRLGFGHQRAMIEIDQVKQH